MATDLADSTEALQRVVARPGTFATLFPETTPAGLVGVLSDGFAEAQLDGLLTKFTVDEDGLVDADLTGAQVALVLLYAGARLVRSELFNRATHKRYVGAGGVTFEEDQATNILRDIMKSLNDQKERVRNYILDNDGIAAGNEFAMMDQYVVRLASDRHWNRSTIGYW